MTEMTTTLPRHRNQLGPWLMIYGLKDAGVEIGTWKGEYAEKLLRSWAGFLYCIDPYKNFDQSEWLDGCNCPELIDYQKEAIHRLNPWTSSFPRRCRMIRETSVVASDLHDFPPLDFVYLDGNHSYESVMRDLGIWDKKLKPGGVMAGHDYYNRDDSAQRCGVKRAVDEWVAKRNAKLHLMECTSWMIVP